MPYGLVIMASKATEESQENTCVVCFKGVDIYSIGQCDHPVCYECSTRMRVLCRQNECPICRQDMPKVIFTKIVQPYNTLKHINGVIDKKFKIAFETEDEKRAYEVLLAHECPKCSKVFTTFTYLRDHVRRVHQLNYCDLCVDNLKIYSRERRCYSRAELTRHRKDGDPDDRSHRGHPLCEFCDTRYMDNDELYRHLRRDHLFCHFCDADGLHQYYSSYDFLRDHFRSEHFLCEEGDCINEKFTAVFRTEIDLKAHKATVHGKGLGKAGLKQARTLELEFTLAPRPRPLHSRQPRHREEDVVPEQFGAAGGQVEDVNTKRAQAPELRREEDFPALGSEASGTSLSLRLTSAKQPSVSIHTSIQVNHPRFTTKVTSQNNYNYHFPALDNSTSGGDVAVTSVSWSACSGGPRGGRSNENKAGIGLPPPEAFPSLAVPTPRAGGASRTSTAVGTDSELTEHRPHQQQSHKQQPQSQPEFQQQPPSKSKKKKSKSGKNADSNSSATSSSSCLTSGESKLKKNKKDVKTSQNKQDHSQINNNIENNNNVENIIKAMSIVSERQPLKPENNEKQNKSTERDDFPSLSAPPGFPAMPPAAAAPRWEVKKPPKPPPGLGKPPPGLPPPGFSGLNGGFPPLIGGPADEDPASLTGYITPNNFAKRNSSLVKLINASLVGETLEEFKQISVAFRRGSLAAPEYYHHCKEMLGPANFRELFPELLALLPDIEKQQALWKLYKLEFNFLEGSKKKGSKLDVCVTCNQVLRTSDLREHLARHGGITTQVPAGSNQNNPWAKVNF